MKTTQEANRTMKWTTILVVVAALLLATAGLAFPRTQDTALAQTGGGYDLTWSSIDSGGYTFSTGGGYSLGGTIGQPDAGQLTGGGYTLGNGFWGGGELAQYKLYLPLVLK